MVASAGLLYLSLYLIIVCCRYNNVTGIATIPPGGAGQYYISTYLQVAAGEAALIDIVVNNDDVFCSAAGDQNNNGVSDLSTAACSGVAQLEAGKLLLEPV